MVVCAGLASLVVASVGLCALNYLSPPTLNAYGSFCAIFALILLVGPPDYLYKTDNFSPTLSKSVIYFALLLLLIVLLLFSVALAHHLVEVNKTTCGELIGPAASQLSSQSQSRGIGQPAGGCVGALTCTCLHPSRLSLPPPPPPPPPLSEHYDNKEPAFQAQRLSFQLNHHELPKLSQHLMPTSMPAMDRSSSASMRPARQYHDKNLKTCSRQSHCLASQQSSQFHANPAPSSVASMPPNLPPPPHQQQPQQQPQQRPHHRHHHHRPQRQRIHKATHGGSAYYPDGILPTAMSTLAAPQLALTQRSISHSRLSDMRTTSPALDASSDSSLDWSSFCQHESTGCTCHFGGGSNSTRNLTSSRIFTTTTDLYSSKDHS